MDLSGREIRLAPRRSIRARVCPSDQPVSSFGGRRARQARLVDSADVGDLPRPYDRRADDLVIFGTNHTKGTMLKTALPVSCIADRAERLLT